MKTTQELVRLFFLAPIFQEKFQEAFALIKRRHGIRQDQDDITQEAYLKMCRHLLRAAPPHLLDPTTPPDPELIFNFCFRNLDWAVRHFQRNRQARQLTDYGLEQHESPRTVPLGHYMTACKIMKKATRSLPRQMRLVVCDWLDDRPIRDTATRLGLSERTVYRLLERFKQLLTRAYQEWAEDNII